MYDHAEELRKQFSSSKNPQNADLIKVLMNKTFRDRRLMLIEKMLLISDVVEKYQVLCLKEQNCMKLSQPTKELYKFHSLLCQALPGLTSQV